MGNRLRAEMVVRPLRAQALVFGVERCETPFRVDQAIQVFPEEELAVLFAAVIGPFVVVDVVNAIGNGLLKG